LLGSTENAGWIVITGNWLKKTSSGLINVESVGEQEVPTTKLITHSLKV